MLIGAGARDRIADEVARIGAERDAAGRGADHLRGLGDDTRRLTRPPAAGTVAELLDAMW